jgi:hypothetical protein
MWSDYLAKYGQQLQYRVVPMIGPESQLARADDRASGWSSPVVVTAQGDKVYPYFNRGVVAAQWLSRQLEDVPANGWHKKLATSMATPGDPIRNFLSGDLRIALLKVLNDANAAGALLYAVLYELDDPVLLGVLKAMGKRANLILANGTHSAKTPDENAAARQELAKVVSLSNRMVTGNHLAHNKFLVVADAGGGPHKVWTGSTNWTESGLCTQANNGILFDDATVAALYKAQWDKLQAAGNEFPPGLIDSNSQRRSAVMGKRPISVWFAPVHKQVDLSQARGLIQGAKEGVLFLIFDPGPKGTLLNDILALDADTLYIHGVANLDPGGKKDPVIKLVHRGHVVTTPAEVALPAAIDDRLKFWLPEMKGFSLVIVHSKLIVVDPFGDHPVVMTGSHNMGPKASGSNDDNLVIVEHDPVLAAQYAVNVMTIYNQYRWRYFRVTSKNPEKWDGLVTTDTWQDSYYLGEKLRELDFWLGHSMPRATSDPHAEAAPRAKVRARSRLKAPGESPPTPAAKRPTNQGKAKKR